MKIFKYLFFLILIILIGGSIYVATIDGDYQAEETMVMNVPVAMVYNEVNDLKTWETWSPWKLEDPNLVINYLEKTKGEGAAFSWIGDKSNDGSIKTVEAIPYQSILQEITFEIPFGESQGELYWVFEPVEGKTKVTWGVKGKLSFFEKIKLTIEDESSVQKFQEKFEKGLKNLNNNLSEKMKEYSINIDGVTEYGGTFYMYVTTASKNTPEALDNKMKQLLPQVTSFMETNDIAMSGAPMIIYNQINKNANTAIISFGAPTPSKVVTPSESDILNGYLERTKALKVTLKGNHSNLPEAWLQAKNYLGKTDFVINKEISPFEIYITDAYKEPNPSRWETEIYIPIKRKESEFTSVKNESL
ncbi:SRPBCC family protein [Mesonia aestuariivivens]|uniref:SRPBCC family protein n=1 Tax=Mesonia aestuariivivens TaxID=2796128 RepID=A0ABS6W1H0_9FLAO|nr:AraC family transcriptional regulator [Mesonia aestuariivivens]MBW2961003.1 SRPBCC family protein [Mesonia aestuariivivens]